MIQINKHWSKLLQGIDEQSQLFTKILILAAPMLYAEKPATLIHFSRNRRNEAGIWERYKLGISKQLGDDYNLKLVELLVNTNGILVLFYHTERLKALLGRTEITQFFQILNYHYIEISLFLKLLGERFGMEFPHEIGVLLGIPLGDTIGFIKNHGENYLFNKYWKVYVNPDQALRTFATYDRARQVVLQRLESQK